MYYWVFQLLFCDIWEKYGYIGVLIRKPESEIVGDVQFWYVILFTKYQIGYLRLENSINMYFTDTHIHRNWFIWLWNFSIITFVFMGGYAIKKDFFFLFSFVGNLPSKYDWEFPAIGQSVWEIFMWKMDFKTTSWFPENP